MGLFSKDKPGNFDHENKGRRGTDRSPLKDRMDGGIHERLAARGQRYIDQVRTQEDDGWKF